MLYRLQQSCNTIDFARMPVKAMKNAPVLYEQNWICLKVLMHPIEWDPAAARNLRVQRL